MSERSVSLGVAGLGYWGPNLARNFAAIPGCELTYCCDESHPARVLAAQSFPQTRICSDLDQLLDDPRLDAIALATPVRTHAELAVRVLRAGKHPPPSWRSAPRVRPDGC